MGFVHEDGLLPAFRSRREIALIVEEKAIVGEEAVSDRPMRARTAIRQLQSTHQQGDARRSTTFIGKS
jgi:hypothetical protein